MTVITPQYRAEPTERTEIRVAYDDRFLYMSGGLDDSDPSSVRANSLYRDAFAGDDLQINLTRFPLFFPEKCQFFQERSEIFAFPSVEPPAVW
jgi:hypothetical protein